MSGISLQHLNAGEYQRADLQREDARQCGAGAGDLEAAKIISAYESQVSGRGAAGIAQGAAGDATKEVAAWNCSFRSRIWRCANRNSARAR